LIWIAQVCDALSYLHNQPSPIIHRDIKPANIKIRSDGRVMLVDFGIAKIYDPQFATVVGARAVTRGYSPPEQYGDGTTDTRSDIYALGATLYHLLTGQIPPESVQRMVSGIALPPPRELNDQISPKIEQTILRAIEVATDSRFQSVGELRAALAQASDGAVPLPATPTTSPPYPQSPDGLTVELPPARQISPIWLGVLAGLGLASLWVVLTFSGVFNGFGAPKGISQTQTRVALGLTQTALAALANTHVTLAASLTPTATRTPTATLVPPTPTATPVPPTLAPTDTPVPPTPTLQPTPIPVVLPQPVAPPGGGGPYRNPITFRWRGALSEGQTYQVTVILVKFPQGIVKSQLQTSQSWTTNLSDSLGTQEYRWRVAVISEGKVVATSAEWTFWHSPIGNPQPP
jgi:serine/threonine protein kinase